MSSHIIQANKHEKQLEYTKSRKNIIKSITFCVQ